MHRKNILLGFTILLGGVLVLVGSVAAQTNYSIPNLISITPTSSLAANAYVQVTITGSDFMLSGNTVHFGPWVNIPNLSSDGTHITFVVPKEVPSDGEVPPMMLPTGDYAVTVTTSAGTSNALTFTLAPLISDNTCTLSVSPAVIKKGGTTTLTWTTNGTPAKPSRPFFISPSIGYKYGNEPHALTVSPKETTTYSGSFYGGGGTCQTTVTVTAAAQSQVIRYTQDIYVGLKNSQVTQLQQDLANDVSLYPEKLMTGYFGQLTLKVVKRFQAKYGIRQTGYVGPLTRAKLNELFGGQ